MTELVQGLYPQALDVGISPFSFWEMSIVEIMDVINSYYRRKRAEQKERAIFDQAQVIQLSENIRKIFGNEKENIKTHSIWEFFPELFPEEYEKNKALQEQNDLEEFKAKRRAFASRHNRDRKVGE